MRAAEFSAVSPASCLDIPLSLKEVRMRCIRKVGMLLRFIYAHMWRCHSGKNIQGKWSKRVESSVDAPQKNRATELWEATYQLILQNILTDVTSLLFLCTSPQENVVKYHTLKGCVQC